MDCAPERPRILVADDYDDHLTMLQMLLQHAPFDVDVAEDGEHAWRRYNEQRENGTPYALLFLDVGMPKSSGLDLARRVRESGDTETKMVFLTGQPDDEMTDGMIKLFGGLKLRKPEDVDRARVVVLDQLGLEDSPL